MENIPKSNSLFTLHTLIRHLKHYAMETQGPIGYCLRNKTLNLVFGKNLLQFALIVEPQVLMSSNKQKPVRAV